MTDLEFAEEFVVMVRLLDAKTVCLARSKREAMRVLVWTMTIGPIPSA